MSGIWDHLFDDEHKQRPHLRSAEEGPKAADERTQMLQKELDDCKERLGRMELLCEGLVEYLKVHHDLNRAELALMITRLDLADGVEDNRIGPDRSHESPQCGKCGRPVNPARKRCVFCHALVVTPHDHSQLPPGPVRRVECVRCRKSVMETSIRFTPEGMTCQSCSYER